MDPIDNIDVICSVQTNGEMLAVRLRFHNVGTTTVLVKDGSAGFGARASAIAVPESLDMEEFDITVGGKPLRYIGLDAYLLASPDRSDFSPVKPGEVIDVRFDRLDDSYEFLPGTHEYELEHYHLQMDERTGEIMFHRSRKVRFTYTKN